MLVLKSTTLGLRYCIARWQAQSVERPLGHLLLVDTERALVGAAAGLLGQKRLQSRGDATLAEASVTSRPTAGR
jgi:hypothetical protein